MRNAIRLVVSAAFTFTVVTTISILWSHVFPRHVSLCTLASDPEAYDHRVVHVEATGLVIFDGIPDSNYIILYETSCGEPGAWASIQVDDPFKLDTTVEAFINSPVAEIRNAHIVVEGEFDQWFGRGCFAPRLGIRGTSVKLTSPVWSEPSPQMPAHSKR